MSSLESNVSVPTELPAKAALTTKENPWPVRLLSSKIAEYIDRMSPLWVEGQVVQFNRRPGASMAFLTLRDTDTDASLSVSLFAKVLDRLPEQISEGSQVVMHAKPTFWAKRGTFQLQADDVKTVGIGELLARIEHLKKALAAEGLFALERKKPLPFFPKKIGLICGRESKAEHDVVVNAKARWPQADFVIREVAVQGVSAVSEVCAALSELDAIAEVEVIIIARGGGAVEDLLPFSNETLVRAAAAAKTPIVSAIGHETDQPILDYVADYRASTPTDAAKRVAPDIAQEKLGVQNAQQRLNSALRNLIDREYSTVKALVSRPVLSNPMSLIEPQFDLVSGLQQKNNQAFERVLSVREADLLQLRTSLRALSPQATLDRGYAIAQLTCGQVLRSADQVEPGAEVLLHLAHGQVETQVLGQDQLFEPLEGK